MARVRNSYWDKRLERWGAWRVGARGLKVATWQMLRVQRTAMADEGALVDHSEELETHALVTELAQHRETLDLARFALAAYPRTTRLAERLGVDRRSLAARFEWLHRVMARMLDQRRRGEPVDPTRRRTPSGRVLTIRGDAPGRKRLRKVAVVVTDA